MRPAPREVTSTDGRVSEVTHPSAENTRIIINQIKQINQPTGRPGTESPIHIVPADRLVLPDVGDIQNGVVKLLKELVVVGRRRRR
jgi:hypothetical protein